MGPTIEEDAAIEFTKNKYINLRIELHGEKNIIDFIRDLNEDVLVYKKKIQIKFENKNKKDVD